MKFRSFIFLLTLLAVQPYALHAGPDLLRSAAESTGVLIGTAVRPTQFSEPAYAATLGREFNMVEPEDAMKWWAVRRTADTFDFGPADEIVRFAQTHAMKVRGHCLVWHQHNPAWLTDGHFTPVQLSQLLHEHIQKEVKHFAGDVFAWDVVNEAFDDKGEVKDSIWYNQPGIGLAGKGTAYIEQALRWAHEADPNALLFYNEAGGEGLNRKSDAIYEMVKDFKKRGVPIDGIGLQLHISLDHDIAPVAANIARLTALGVQVHITELDVRVPVDSYGEPANKDDLLRQAEVYGKVVRACLQSTGCTAIQTWGFTDKYSWIGWFTHGVEGAALPFDRTYQPKLAYQAMLQELSAGRNPPKHRK